MGTDAEAIYDSFVYGEEDENPELDYDIVIGKFKNYFVPGWNAIHNRKMFCRREQTEGETVEDFVRSLYEFAEHSNFGAAKDT